MSYPWKEESHKFCVGILRIAQDLEFKLADKAREIRLETCNVLPDSSECKISRQLVNALDEASRRIFKNYRKHCDPKGEYTPFKPWET